MLPNKTQPFSLLPYQTQHALKILHAIKTHGFALDASDTGTGKTAIAAWCVAQLGMKAYVICPKAVKPTWRYWLLQAGIPEDRMHVENYEAFKNLIPKTKTTDKNGKTKVNFKWVRRPDILCIFDEVHKCKATDSQNAELLIAAARVRQPMLLLSATAARSPLEMRALGYATGLHRLKDFWAWAKAHGAIKGFHGGIEWRQTAANEKFLQKIHKALFVGNAEANVPPKGSRIQVAELGDQFPSTQIEAVAYDAGEETRKNIDMAYGLIGKPINVPRTSKLYNEFFDNSLANIIYARQQAEMLKVELFEILTKEALEKELSVVLFLNWRASCQKLIDRFPGCSYIYGGQREAERAEHCERFQRDESHVCCVMLQAGGCGISLHGRPGGRRRLALISPSYSAIDMKQALGRVWRADGAGHSIQHIVFVDGSIEANICKSLSKKLKALDIVNNGLRALDSVASDDFLSEEPYVSLCK